MNFKKVFLSILFATLTLSGVVLFYSCQKDKELTSMIINTDYEEFNSFFNSESYASFSEKFKVNSENFDLNNLSQVQFQEQNVNLYQTLIYKKEKVIGRIAVFSKNKGQTFRVLFEDWSSFDEKCGGEITLYTSKKHFVASFLCEKVDSESNLFSVHLNKVVDNSIPRLKSTTVEFPSDDDPWWECLTQCYKVANDACSGDAECDFLCELIGLGTNISCFIAISTACAIYCI